MAFTMAEKYMEPALLATFTGMIEQPPAAPATPTPLPAIAAATPAQAVPCPGLPLLSMGLLSLSPKS